MELQGVSCYFKLYSGINTEIYTNVHFFGIIHVFFMSTPSDASQSTSQERLHIQIYRMVIDGYIHAE